MTGEDECYVAWFEPADPEAVSFLPSVCEGLLPVADNGAGDRFLIDPRQSDPELFYFTHEDDALESTGVRLSEFLNARRRPVPRE